MHGITVAVVSRSHVHCQVLPNACLKVGVQYIAARVYAGQYSISIRAPVSPSSNLPDPYSAPGLGPHP